MRLIITLFTVALLSLSNSAFAACGKISLADMNWNSATLLANIDRYILQHGYGCDAELVPGDTVSIGTSMTEKGEPDVASELWTNSFSAALAKGVTEKRLRIAGQSLSDGGEEGFWLPKYMVDKDPGLATIKGVMAKVKMFPHPEEDGRSAFMGCPAGWACQISASNLFKALKLKDAGFDLVDPGSGAALAGSIAKAYERKQPWFGYYWAPTAVLGKYEMVKVDFGTGVDDEEYNKCTSKEDCLSPKVTMYPSSPVQIVTTEAFAKRAPEAFAYLGKRSFTNKNMNVLLAWMEDNQADGDVAMEHFLRSYEKQWTPWVSKAAAKKIKAALKSM